MMPRLEVEAPDFKLRVGAAEVVSLLGANGAGKSTLLRAVMGFEAFPGRIRLDGVELGSTPPFRRNRLGIGYCPEGRRVFPRMTVRENLEVAGRSDAAARLADILSLPRWRRARVRSRASSPVASSRCSRWAAR